MPEDYTPEDLARGYTIETWREYDNFICVYCQFATLWLPKMEKHQALGRHPWAYPGQYAPTVGATADGEQGAPEY